MVARRRDGAASGADEGTRTTAGGVGGDARSGEGLSDRTTFPPVALSVPLPGATFHGCYRILRVLKAGGMGAVFEAVDVRTDRRRALKVLLPAHALDDDMRLRFEQEARITANVRSEHLVDTVDTGVDDETGLPFLAMELLDGDDVETLLARRGRLPLAEVVDVATQAARGLDRLHAVGVVHRDVTPANLFVGRGDDGSPRVKLVDYGTAKVVADIGGDAKTTRALGTPTYMAPEQIDGDGTIDGRADVYALAQVVYTALVGEPYFTARDARGGGLLLAVARGTEEAASARAGRAGIELPPGFDAWFARATAHDRSVRPAWAGDLAAELAALADGHATRPLADGHAEPGPTVRTGAEPRAAGAKVSTWIGLALGAVVVPLLLARPASRRAAPALAAPTLAARTLAASDPAEPLVDPADPLALLPVAPPPPAAAAAASASGAPATASPAGGGAPAVASRPTPAAPSSRARRVVAAPFPRIVAPRVVEVPAAPRDPTDEWQ